MSSNAVLAPFYRSVFCGARRRQGVEGATCRRPAGWGTEHVGIGRCKMHGGATPTHVVAASTALARRVAALFGVPRDDVNPIDGLLEELQRSAGLIDSYEAMCVQLLPDEVTYGVLSEESTRTVDPNADGEGEAAGTDLAPVETKTRRGATVNTWVKLLNEERDRFTRLCEAMVKLDLESRRLSVQHEHVAAIVSILMSSELGLSVEQKRAAARMLRTIDQRDTLPVVDGEVVTS